MILYVVLFILIFNMAANIIPYSSLLRIKTLEERVETSIEIRSVPPCARVELILNGLLYCYFLMLSQCYHKGFC